MIFREDFMAHERAGWMFWFCRVAIVYILTGLTSVCLFSPVYAEEPCLRIAMPEVRMTGDSLDSYRLAMQQAGLCVLPVPMPLLRMLVTFNRREIDGVFAALNDFPQSVKRSVIRGNVRVGSFDGILVAPKNGAKAIDDLSGEILGVWLGASWSSVLVQDYAHVIRVPRGPDMMQKMLRQGRLDVMLLDEYSLAVSGGLPDGFQANTVLKMTAHSWLASEFSGFLPAFDEATARYLEQLVQWREKAK